MRDGMRCEAAVGRFRLYLRFAQLLKSSIGFNSGALKISAQDGCMKRIFYEFILDTGGEVSSIRASSARNCSVRTRSRGPLSADFLGLNGDRFAMVFEDTFQ
jgi:hypothetical protein